eukprot:scaffold266407_cov45-Prasinocladus_malaysianus.AAC.1
MSEELTVTRFSRAPSLACRVLLEPSSSISWCLRLDSSAVACASSSSDAGALLSDWYPLAFASSPAPCSGPCGRHRIKASRPNQITPAHII